MRRGLLVAGVGLGAAALAVGAGARWLEGVPLVRACEVLTEEFAEQAIGEAVLSSDDMGRRVTQCQYMSDPVGESVNLVAERYKATKRESGPERARRLGLKHRGKPYPGLGEAAYLSLFEVHPPGEPHRETSTGQLVVLVEDVVIRAGVGGRPVAEIRAVADRLARAYLARVDA